MGFAMRFIIFSAGTILAVLFAPEKLRRPGASNVAAVGAWLLSAGLIFTI